MEAYSFSDAFRERIQKMYTNATSAVQINRILFRPISLNAQFDKGAPLVWSFCSVHEPIPLYTIRHLDPSLTWKTHSRADYYHVRG
jgi:hypothetical protein